MENTIKIEISVNGDVKNLVDSINALVESHKASQSVSSKCNKPITERIKTIDDVLQYHWLNKSGIESKFSGLPTSLLSYYYLTLVIEALNDGWKPDFNNGDQIKYYNWFKIENGLFVFCSVSYDCRDVSGPSALYFKSEELALYAKDNFLDLYKSVYNN